MHVINSCLRGLKSNGTKSYFNLINDVYGHLHSVQMFDVQGPEVVATNFIPGENVFGDTETLAFAATDKTSIEKVVFKIYDTILKTITTSFDTITRGLKSNGTKTYAKDLIKLLSISFRSFLT